MTIDCREIAEVARPRAFDEAKVVEQAMAAFWELGYQATSFDDLVAATGLSRSSLTAAFGDKETLFSRVLEHYSERQSKRVLAMLKPQGARATLEKLLHGWIGLTKPKAGPCGCFLSLSGMSGDAPGFARKQLLRSQKILQTELSAIIAQGQRTGEFEQGAKPNRLAAFCVVVLQGIAATARAGWRARELHAAVDETLRVIVGSPSTARCQKAL